MLIYAIGAVIVWVAVNIFFWKLSFDIDKENIDVSKIAAEFGGGGHLHAAGASKLPELPAFLRRKHD